MKYYCNPINTEYKFQFVKHDESRGGKTTIYREAADPSLVLFNGLYYLFPSMMGGFLTSENLTEWKYNKFIGDMPIYDYAPDVCVVKDYLYFSASKRNANCSFYRCKDPLNEAFEEIEGTFPFWDPHMFCDDDGRLYFYWGCSNITPIYGVELDQTTLIPKTNPCVMITPNNKVRGYERVGNNHIPPKTEEQIKADVENMVTMMMNMPEEIRKAKGILSENQVRAMTQAFMGNDPYIEGAWMTKYENKYYLQYAIPGTEYNIYGDGVFVSSSPLGPFELAKNNPYSYKPGGFINGAGHGSTLRDKNNNYWHTSTMTISKNDDMERRLGLWKAGIDKDGVLYCDQRYGDWPINIETPAFSNPEFMLLSYNKDVKTSSGINGHYVTDENIKTVWKAESANDEWVEINLGKPFEVHAIQINFAEDNIKIDCDITYEFKANGSERYIDLASSNYIKWILEGSVDGNTYFTIKDKSDANTDYSHDFIMCESEMKIQYVRLRIIEVPYNQNPAISGLRVFGKDNEKLPLPVQKINIQKISELDVKITWNETDAVGYNVLWGYSPDKLYHSSMVYGKSEYTISALIAGEGLYVRIDSFNETGISEGNVEKVF
ncbi:family 43 glycosylhydrolase [[Eubacterium] hominis]|uniref:family 43 glycosylhydrolase n=1 Tax=[Eubacterium] hominis TaxID=2764325 RepID=UPI003A4D4D27